MPTTRILPQKSLYDIELEGLGLLSMNYNPGNIASNSALTSQVIYAAMVPVRAGVTYTGVKLVVGQAASGAAPTSFFVGLASNANLASPGTMLAQSSNLKDSASLTTAGAQSFAFSATYTESASGLRAVILLQDGAFGGTNVQFGRCSPAAFGSANGSQPLFATAGTGQTALPANAAALGNYSASSVISMWVGLY